MVRLQFTIELNYEVAEPSDFVFNICAVQNAHQKIMAEKLDVSSGLTPVIFLDTLYGNRHIRLHADAGALRVFYAATVDIDQFLAERESIGEVPMAQLPEEVLPYVYPSRYCESDTLINAAVAEFGNLPRGYGRVEAIRRWVQQRTAYMPGTTVSTTSAVDIFVQHRGVCRDFAHLMIAICRALNIPARFVTGLDYGADPALGAPDFHAYVEVYLGDRWYLFDPTGMTIPMGLPRIGTARDAADVSFATIFGRVQGGNPIVNIRAIEDSEQGLVMPHHSDYAISSCALTQRYATAQPLAGCSPPDILCPANNPPAGRHYAPAAHAT